MNGREAIARARSLLRGRHFSSLFLLFAVALISAAICVAAVDNILFLINIDNFIQDYEFPYAAHEQPSDDRVRIAAIDENTMSQLHYRSPIDRSLLADLLTRLDASHARAIGVDVLFDQATEPAKDAELEHVIRTLKTPLIIAYTEEDVNVTPQQLAYLRAYVPAKDRATPDLPKDSYGIVRTIHPGMKIADGHFLLSFERALAERYGVHTADKTGSDRLAQAAEGADLSLFRNQRRKRCGQCRCVSSVHPADRAGTVRTRSSWSVRISALSIFIARRWRQRRLRASCRASSCMLTGFPRCLMARCRRLRDGKRTS